MQFFAKTRIIKEGRIFTAKARMLLRLISVLSNGFDCRTLMSSRIYRKETGSFKKQPIARTPIHKE